MAIIEEGQEKKSSPIFAGWINGFIGVLIFSGSLPATKLAIADFNPLFLTFCRASIAGIIAVLLVTGLREKVPHRAHLGSLLIVALGVVIGFPLLTAMALKSTSASHSIVFLGLLPLMTAIFGVLRAGERPQASFWLFSVLGSGLVVGYALLQGASLLTSGDLLMLSAIIVCGLGYAEGAKLSRMLGGWQVICWSLIIALPCMLFATYVTLPQHFAAITTTSWLALGYVSLFSMLLGFIFWYNGLAIGGITAVGQLQLLQPFIGLALSALLLHEKITFTMLLVSVGVIICVVGAKKFAKR
nr:DMT family transporter [Rosenbergiella australiborealis]